MAFMTQAYSDSENVSVHRRNLAFEISYSRFLLTRRLFWCPQCRLELKFAKQSGIPIVPVKLGGEAGEEWKPTAWLGIIVAGSREFRKFP